MRTFKIIKAVCIIMLAMFAGLAYVLAESLLDDMVRWGDRVTRELEVLNDHER